MWEKSKYIHDIVKDLVVLKYRLEDPSDLVYINDAIEALEIQERLIRTLENRVKSLKIRKKDFEKWNRDTKEKCS